MPATITWIQLLTSISLGCALSGTVQVLKNVIGPNDFPDDDNEIQEICVDKLVQSPVITSFPGKGIIITVGPPNRLDPLTTDQNAISNVLSQSTSENLDHELSNTDHSWVYGIYDSCAKASVTMNFQSDWDMSKAEFLRAKFYQTSFLFYGPVNQTKNTIGGIVSDWSRELRLYFGPEHHPKFEDFGVLYKFENNAMPPDTLPEFCTAFTNPMTGENILFASANTQYERKGCCIMAA